MTRSRALVLVLAMGVCVTAAPGGAWAMSCSVGATAVNFGTYNPLSGTPDDATGTVTVTCDTLVGLFASWTVALSTGNGSYSPRLLKSGASSLSYNLYTTVAHTNVWGDGSGTTTLVSDHATLIIGANVTHYTVYGHIPAGQDAAAGSYTDTIVVTVNY